MLPLVLMVGVGIFRVDWVAVATPPAAGEVDWKLFIQIMFWTSTYWQKVRKKATLCCVVLRRVALCWAAPRYGRTTMWLPYFLSYFAGVVIVDKVAQFYRGCCLRRGHFMPRKRSTWAKSRTPLTFALLLPSSSVACTPQKRVCVTHACAEQETARCSDAGRAFRIVNHRVRVHPCTTGSVGGARRTGLRQELPTGNPLRRGNADAHQRYHPPRGRRRHGPRLVPVVGARVPQVRVGRLSSGLYARVEKPRRRDKKGEPLWHRLTTTVATARLYGILYRWGPGTLIPRGPGFPVLAPPRACGQTVPPSFFLPSLPLLSPADFGFFYRPVFYWSVSCFPLSP